MDHIQSSFASTSQLQLSELDWVRRVLKVLVKEG